MQVSTQASKVNWAKLVADGEKAETSKRLLVSWFWYVGWPVFFFVILAPGFLVSIPKARDCDTAEPKFIAPERASPAAVAVHAILFFGLTALLFWWGSKLGIRFPFIVKGLCGAP